ncbi:MAG TPA: hypothetical protein VFE47_12905 [Tepidisphaeraceae bacterium]|nr:hypothetical protein [Tepidisphaeraceae bacterium]
MKFDIPTPSPARRCISNIVLAILLTCIGVPKSAFAQAAARRDPDPTAPEKKVIFIIDGAGLPQEKLDVVADQVRGAIATFKPIQLFNIIIVNENGISVLFPELSHATPESKRRFEPFIKQLKKSSKHDVIPALSRALKEQPDLIFLLAHESFTDNDAVIKKAREINPKSMTIIDTLAFDPPDDDKAIGDTLKTIARNSGGTMKVVKTADIPEPAKPAPPPAHASSRAGSR